MANGENSYTESLLKWGNSGSFFPSLVPSVESAQSLQRVQSQIVGERTNAKSIDSIHMSLLHCKPKQLYKYMVKNVGPDVRPELLYMDLENIFTTVYRSFRGEELPVVGIGEFGSDESVIVAKIGYTASFASWRGQIRELFNIALKRNGASDQQVDDMGYKPEFQWSLGESTPHISLTRGIGLADIPRIRLPASVYFDGVSEGTARVPTDDPIRWHTMPGYEPTTDIEADYIVPNEI